jgi:hypothetical protein
VKRWNLVRGLFIIISSAAVLFFFSIYLFSQTRIAGDAASHLLLAIAPILKIGSPYKDFWDIKPPVLPLVLYLWSNLFGFGILSVRIINIIIAAFVILISYLVYKKVFPTPVLEIVFLYTIIILFSPIINSIMIPTEILGLLLSMGALLILISVRNDFPRFYFSGLLFFATSQTKEPFTFTVLAVLPVLFESLLQGGFRKVIKNLIQFLLGILTCLAGIYIYLASLGSVGAYTEVLQYKQIFFPLTFENLSQNFLPGLCAATRTFIESSGGLIILIIFAIFSFYLVNKIKGILSFNLRSSKLIIKPFVLIDSEKTKKYTVLFYALGSFLGFGLGKIFGSHYLIQVVIPFYIIGGFLTSYIFSNSLFLFNKSRLYFYLAIILFGFSLIILMPKRPYLSNYLPRSINFTMKDDVFGFEKRVTELTTRDQCVLSVYGWGTGENYLYSMRRPCTRFFLANIVLLDWQKKEYAKDVKDNPPAAIVYQIHDTDMDIQKFESEVININKIVRNCYTQDTKENVVYVPKMKNYDDLKDCVKANST